MILSQLLHVDEQHFQHALWIVAKLDLSAVLPRENFGKKKNEFKKFCWSRREKLMNAQNQEEKKKKKNCFSIMHMIGMQSIKQCHLVFSLKEKKKTLFLKTEIENN